MKAGSLYDVWPNYLRFSAYFHDVKNRFSYIGGTILTYYNNIIFFKIFFFDVSILFEIDIYDVYFKQSDIKIIL